MSGKDLLLQICPNWRKMMMSWEKQPSNNGRKEHKLCQNKLLFLIHIQNIVY